MLSSTIKRKMLKFINDYFIKESGIILKDDTLLVEDDIIDSTGVLELVAFIEETFEIKVEDEEIISQNLDTINRLVDFIQLKLVKKTADLP